MEENIYLITFILSHLTPVLLVKPVQRLAKVMKPTKMFLDSPCTFSSAERITK